MKSEIRRLQAFALILAVATGPLLAGCGTGEPPPPSQAEAQAIEKQNVETANREYAVPSAPASPR
ncbi:MAG: hypothetical protein IRY99_11355 [Isosphaeraceae bacterium]|nr:hypothetical protein [Isosphaeraceae bacterium]